MAQKAMTEHDFQRNLAAAETLARIAQNSVEYNFWVGYIRGLRRFYYGENFGTKDEHSHLIAACDSSYQAEKMLGMGYRAGLIGQNVHQANFSALSNATNIPGPSPDPPQKQQSSGHAK
jgi:hypothetical protein